MLRNGYMLSMVGDDLMLMYSKWCWEIKRA